MFLESHIGGTGLERKFSPKVRWRKNKGGIKMKDKTTVVISYNPVKGFNSGWHEGKDVQVFICANDDGWGCDTGKGDDDYERAGSVMHDLGHEYYDGKVPVEGVQEYFVYSGLYAFRQAISMAEELKQKSGAQTSVVACSCRWDKKENMLDRAEIPLIKCECGGRVFLGKMVREMLN